MTTYSVTLLSHCLLLHTGGHSLLRGQSGDLLFTENETNNKRLFGTDNPTRYVKDGINDYVVAGIHDAVNPEDTETKAAAHYELHIGAQKSATISLRFLCLQG